MNFKEAVESIVDEKISKIETFSAHNITEEFRKRISNNNITVSDRTPTDVDIDGIIVNTVEVKHSEVKEIVHNHMSMIDSVVGYVRASSKGYWEYEPIPKTDTKGDAKKDSSGGTAYDGTPILANKGQDV